MSLLLETACEQLRDLQAGAISSVELTRAYLDRISAVDGRVGRFCESMASGRSHGLRKSISGAQETAGWPAGRPAGGGEGYLLRARRADDVRVADAGGVSCRRMMRQSSLSCKRPGRCSLAGRTWMSSRWAGRRRIPHFRRRTIRGTSRGRRAVRAAVRRRRGGGHGAAGAWAPTRAVRFASRPGCAASWG